MRFRMVVKRKMIRYGIISSGYQKPDYSDSQAMGDLETRLRARIGERLRPRSAQAGLAARLTTHGQGWLSRYLSGELEMDLPTLEEIAAIWRIPVSVLLGETPLPPLTRDEMEAQRIAALWPHVPEQVRGPIRMLIERLPNFASGPSTAPKSPESAEGSAPEAPAGSRPASGKRRGR